MEKKGIVSISTFSFIILILFGLFGLTYYFYLEFNENLEILNQKHEVLNSIESFKSSILSISLISNSYLNYTNELDSQDLIIYLNNSNIVGQKYFKDNLIEENSSLYGIGFCDSYIFSPKNLNRFYFNGSCISLIN